MGVTLYLFIWGSWAKNRKLAVTFKYLIRFSKSRACWMKSHEKIVKIFKQNNNLKRNRCGTLFPYLGYLGQK